MASDLATRRILHSLRVIITLLRKHMLGISFIVIVLVSWWYPYFGQLSRNYAFVPYGLNVNPGPTGDGGLSYPPAAVPPPGPPHKILTGPLPLQQHDLGWAGDYITYYDPEKWEVVAVVENRPQTPAMLAANYGLGQIVYVTNQLAPHENLVYNILAWHFNSTLRNTVIKVALMIDVPPGQILNDWEDCFSRVQNIGRAKSGNVTVSVTRIEQYALADDAYLRQFNVLAFAVRWGDGLAAPGSDWNWNRLDRTDAIRNYVQRGGLLLLPEAGWLIDFIGFELPDGYILPPVRPMQEYFSNQTSSFAMAGVSLSGVGWVVTMRREIGQTTKKYNWIVAFLFGAGILWFIVPICTGQLLVQTAVVLWALLMDLDVAAIGIVLYLRYCLK